MNILMTSTSYPLDSGDWRGVFIRNLVAGVARTRGVRLRLWAPPGPTPEGVDRATTPNEDAWLGELMRAGGVSHLMRQRGWRSPVAPLKLLRMLRACYLREKADLYHINWLQCALPLPDDGKPAVISVLGNDLNLLRLPGMVALLRRSMRNRRVALCPNAEWMVPELIRSFGDVAHIVPVSFGIDAMWYAIERRPTTPPRWLAVTRLTTNKLGPLFDWARPMFQGEQRELHLFGPMQEAIAVPTWVCYHGAATPEQLSTTWFPSAQGLITLSTHAEGRPQTMLEAMASGLPIIASDMSAHASIVAQGRTGFLCRDPVSFADAVECLENPATCAALGEASREWARSQFGSWDDAANRYTDVYELLRARR